MIGGQLVQGLASYAHGQDQAYGYRAEAAAKRAQAAQVQIASDREVALIEQRGEKIKNAQSVAIGASGVQLRGSPLAQMEETAANVVSEMRAAQNAARYKKNTILTEGMLSEYNADAAESAGFLGFLGAGLGAASKNPYAFDSPRKANQAQGGFYGGSDPATDFGGIA